MGNFKGGHFVVFAEVSGTFDVDHEIEHVFEDPVTAFSTDLIGSLQDDVSQKAKSPLLLHQTTQI